MDRADADFGHWKVSVRPFIECQNPRQTHTEWCENVFNAAIAELTEQMCIIYGYCQPANSIKQILSPNGNLCASPPQKRYGSLSTNISWKTFLLNATHGGKIKEL